MVNAFIYQKLGSISSATNKTFDSGEVINFVQVDSQTMFYVFYAMPMVAKMPAIFGLSFTMLFIYFGWSFLAGLSVFIVAFGVNTFLGLWLMKIQKEIMKKKDARMKDTTEAFNNAKMVKLYAWSKLLYEKIMDKRRAEITVMKKGGIVTAGLIACIYLFPNLLPAVTFSSYIGWGNSLDLATAVTALILFNMMRDTLIELPFFASDFLSMAVSMKRIQKFVELDEVQKNIRESVVD